MTLYHFVRENFTLKGLRCLKWKLSTFQTRVIDVFAVQRFAFSFKYTWYTSIFKAMLETRVGIIQNYENENFHRIHSL